MNNFSKIGYEYGIKPRLLLAGDVEFSKCFVDANCLGVMYMFDRIKNIPVKILFIFKNEKPAEKFMTNLLQWVELSNNNGDAVDIEFIEENKGGYTIVITPNKEHLIERLTPPHLKNEISPIVMVAMQFKKIETVSPSFRLLRDRWNMAESIAIGYVIMSNGTVQKQSEKYFTKSKFKFHKDTSATTNKISDVYQRVKMAEYDGNDQYLKSLNKPEEIKLHRMNALRKYYPITYNKLEQQSWLINIISNMSAKYELAYIYQAICNLILFERLKQIDNLPNDFTGTGYPTNILEHILSTYESFKSYYPNDDFFTVEKIIIQISNDKHELSEYLKK